MTRSLEGMDDKYVALAGSGSNAAAAALPGGASPAQKKREATPRDGSAKTEDKAAAKSKDAPSLGKCVPSMTKFGSVRIALEDEKVDVIDSSLLDRHQDRLLAFFSNSENAARLMSNPVQLGRVLWNDVHHSIRKAKGNRL